jgi:uncharacterized protein YyaL (SSP411 family)
MASRDSSDVMTERMPEGAPVGYRLSGGLRRRHLVVASAGAFVMACGLGAGAAATENRDPTASPLLASATPLAAPTTRASTEPGALPGGAPRDAALTSRLRRALSDQPPGYAPRTRHLTDDGAPLYTNRLILESSPYLLQHAHNPVDWYAWGEEAFAAARRLDRPIFLSVGYSTCHWCHVMERESFEDPEVAAYLNANFIAVKVDREERPDVDAVYMEVVMALTGSGGWPMNVVLTPDRKPFFGGTYFPPRAGVRGAGAGLEEILRNIVRAYRDEREAVVAHAQDLTKRLQAAAAPKSGGDVPGAEVLSRASALLAAQYDAAHGGFGGAPKFPQSARLDFLLRHAGRSGDEAALRRATTTLDHMADGGIRDHVGGGFHRYATDRAWRVPHFEKMLYDNALLAATYLEAFQATGEQRYARVASEVLDDMIREMADERGAFHSASDADSPAPGGHEEEGRFFTWTPAELEEVLGPDRARMVALRYGVTAEGNLEGRSVLHVARSVEDVAAAVGLPAPDVDRELEAARLALREARARRPPPLEDDKVLADWNGLAISALARGARVLREPRFAAAASRAASFLLDEMVKDGDLARSWRRGRIGAAAVLDDYAFLIAGLIDLYETTAERRWLAAAIALQARMDERFADRDRGGYFLTPAGGEELLFRDKPIYDGALPSGNSVAVMNLLRLHELTADDRHRAAAVRAFAAFGPELTAAPLIAPRLLSALDFHLDVVKEVVLVRPDASADLTPFLDVLARAHVPNSVLVVATEGDEAERLAELVPWVEGKPARGGAVTAYVCERRVCRLPTADAAVFATQLTARAATPADGRDAAAAGASAGSPNQTPTPAGAKADA